MRNLIDNIEKSGFLVTTTEVEKLARMRHDGFNVALAADSTYLRILLAMAKARVKRNVDAATAVERVHAELYPAILLGVHTQELDALNEAERKQEINRRATFARTAASTIRIYLQLGGTLKSLDIPTVTKFQLYTAFRPPEPEDRSERTVQRAEKSLLGALKKVAKKDVIKAETEIERLMDELKRLLDTLLHPVVTRTSLQRTAHVENRAHQ